MAVAPSVPFGFVAYCRLSTSHVPAWVPCLLTVSLETYQR